MLLGTFSNFKAPVDESIVFSSISIPGSETGTDPVAITGKPGTVAIFDCNTLHASGHNLSAKDRWQIYLCYNRCTNHPIDIDDPRPDYVRSTNWEPMTFLNDNSIVTQDLS